MKYVFFLNRSQLLMRMITVLTTLSFSMVSFTHKHATVEPQTLSKYCIDLLTVKVSSLVFIHRMNKSGHILLNDCCHLLRNTPLFFLIAPLA